MLKAAATKGVLLIASAGYREAGPEGREAEDELVALADELDILLVGPNGQGVVSPRRPVRPDRRPVPAGGPHGGQSGNFVSSFQNYARHSGIGISRAVSAGNCAAVTVPDFLEWFAEDPATDVALAYLEGVDDGRDLFERLRRVASRKPLVIVKGGVSEGGARAAASHTGSLAADDAVFDGVPSSRDHPRRHRGGGVRGGGQLRHPAAAARESGGRLHHRRRLGSGHCGRHRPDGPGAAPAARRPSGLVGRAFAPRWSRNNPVDLAGSETRDTIPDMMEIVVSHDSVDAVIFLGMGIQGNLARMEREGPFYPDGGLERIVEYHERQEERHAQAAADLSTRMRKPILTATELSITDPATAGPRGAPAVGSATPRPTGPSRRWSTCGTTPAGGSAGDCRSSWGDPLMRRFILPALLVAAIVGCTATAVVLEADRGTASVSESEPGPTTPVLSVRRTPSWWRHRSPTTGCQPGWSGWPTGSGTAGAWWWMPGTSCRIGRMPP